MTEMHNPPHPGVSWDMDLRLSKALGTTRRRNKRSASALANGRWRKRLWLYGSGPDVRDLQAPALQAR